MDIADQILSFGNLRSVTIGKWELIHGGLVSVRGLDFPWGVPRAGKKLTSHANPWDTLSRTVSIYTHGFSHQCTLLWGPPEFHQPMGQKGDWKIWWALPLYKSWAHQIILTPSSVTNKFNSFISKREKKDSWSNSPVHLDWWLSGVVVHSDGWSGRPH